MQKFIFTGDVWPKADTVSCPTLTFRWNEERSQAHMHFSMNDSKVVIECFSSEANREEPAPFGRMLGMVMLFGQSVLDAFAFISANGLTLILTEITYEDGLKSNLRTLDSDLVGICTSLSLDRFNEAMPFIVSHQLLLFALNDLHMALTMPAQLFVCCGRAVDAMRKLISGIDNDSFDGWPELRSAINVSRPYVQLVTDESRNPRHGSRAKGGPAQAEVKRRAWTIVDRSIIYLQRGRVALTDPEYPLL